LSRIFWDTMLFVYLMEDNPAYSARVDALLSRAHRRNDRLFASCLTLGEIMAGQEKASNPQAASLVRDSLAQMGFSFLPFDEGAAHAFGKLRAKEKLKAPDAIHLACAASAGIDLFLTCDKQLTRLDVPGIQFIADFNSPIF
jgi:predicted nucleic acid-binding protein